MRKSFGTAVLAIFALAPAADAFTCEVSELPAPRAGGLSAPSAINNEGLVVGTSAQLGSGGWDATLWKGAEPKALALAGQDHLFSWARSINAAGQVAGYQEGQVFQALRWDAEGKVTALEAPAGSLGSFATSINNRRTIVGYAWIRADDSAPPVSRPVLWTGTKATVLPSPDGAEGWALSINDSGQIVGYSRRADGTFATMWQGDGAMFIDNSGGSVAQGINNRGQVVGYAGTPGAYMAMLWNSRSSFTYLPSLGGESFANAINDRGQIVGSSGGRAVLWDGTMVVTDLNGCLDPASGWVLTNATGINDRGVIVGTAVVPGADGASRGFKLVIDGWRAPALSSMPAASMGVFTTARRTVEAKLPAMRAAAAARAQHKRPPRQRSVAP